MRQAAVNAVKQGRDHSRFRGTVIGFAADNFRTPSQWFKFSVALHPQRPLAL